MHEAEVPVVIWVGQASGSLAAGWAKTVDRYLPQVSESFVHPPTKFSAAEWRSFMKSAMVVKATHPVVRSLERLPALFVHPWDRRIAQDLGALCHNQPFSLGSAREFADAIHKVVAINSKLGVSSEPVVRKMLFASAAVGINKPVNVWVVPASLWAATARS